MSTTALGTAFLLAVVVILLLCRGVALLLRPLGQPPVVAEMIAGVLLGPSVLGLVLPSVEHHLFPADLRPMLYVTGQLGLTLFMFQSGYEFRLERIRPVLRSAALISVAGSTVPLLLGAGLTWAVRGSVDTSPPGVPLHVTVLFVGVTLAITAFPMLARIITENGLSGTSFGTISLAAGALDDVAAWILLAGVVSLARGSAHTVVLATTGAAGLVAVLVALVRLRAPLLRACERLSSEQLLLGTLLLLCLSAWYTDRIGLYAVFGAFSLGAAYPRSPRIDRAIEQTAPLSRTLLLPLFFTYSGLNTDTGLLGDPRLLLFAVGCTAAAVVGKFGACWAAARLAGQPSGVALRIGTLMNARGLMQLIAINVGLSEGIVSPSMFTVLVMVAVVTTVMATPLLRLWDRWDGGVREEQEPAGAGAADDASWPVEAAAADGRTP
ncbi:transporter, CPA2 family [Actinacidiphila yanglinensis]|uniref:Transporter, CPA2 family n=1 Tax=Actinacidiphila yanglinensis TaxID=310779 RepID=A0A1H6CVQ6_9ACTN|nr:cation:proton antiporter [Actinacidiphila yanglinensis]SEG76928.1 transporter, CPA2 family [Actinacidiphila yanglinensis]